MNARQAHRIFKQVELFEEYVASRLKLHEPIDRFLQLTNGFLIETNKTVKVADQGALRVALKDVAKLRPLMALSSGERQILVMLAHLSLNERLAGSGVFIVDEPELSLHISWQERFVDAIQKANPNVQLIMATHSPAVILDKLDNCRSLS
jgi:predicted ATP-binding protein involved in virulence